MVVEKNDIFCRLEEVLPPSVNLSTGYTNKK